MDFTVAGKVDHSMSRLIGWRVPIPAICAERIQRRRNVSDRDLVHARVSMLAGLDACGLIKFHGKQRLLIRDGFWQYLPDKQSCRR
jgi:hypothetical protein